MLGNQQDGSLSPLRRTDFRLDMHGFVAGLPWVQRPRALHPCPWCMPYRENQRRRRGAPAPGAGSDAIVGATGADWGAVTVDSSILNDVRRSSAFFSAASRSCRSASKRTWSTRSSFSSSTSRPGRAPGAFSGCTWAVPSGGEGVPGCSPSANRSVTGIIHCPRSPWKALGNAPAARRRFMVSRETPHSAAARLIGHAGRSVIRGLGSPGSEPSRGLSRDSHPLTDCRPLQPLGAERDRL